MDHNRPRYQSAVVVLHAFRRSHTKTKEELDVQLGQVNLYSRLLDESNTVVQSVDKQLKRLQEGGRYAQMILSYWKK